MFTINYIGRSCSIEGIEEMTEDELRYYFYTGDVVLKSSNGNINLEWEWIPLFDFSLNMKRIAGVLSKGGGDEVERFEFTESDDLLFFERKEDLIKISTSFSTEEIIVKFNEFEAGVGDFLKTIMLSINDLVGDDLFRKKFENFLN
jgi:hypothetical protein